MNLAFADEVDQGIDEASNLFPTLPGKPTPQGLRLDFAHLCHVDVVHFQTLLAVTGGVATPPGSAPTAPTAALRTVVTELVEVLRDIPLALGVDHPAFCIVGSFNPSVTDAISAIGVHEDANGVGVEAFGDSDGECHTLAFAQRLLARESSTPGTTA